MFLIGRIGKDPIIKTNVVSLSLATASNHKVGESWESKTEWHRVIAFGKQAETIKSYVKKGDQLYIEGRLQTREYEKDGQKRTITEIIAASIELLGSKNPSEQKPVETSSRYADVDDDIPF